MSSLSRFHKPNDGRDNGCQRGEILIWKTEFLVPCAAFVIDGRFNKVVLLTVFVWDGISPSSFPFSVYSWFLLSLFYIEQMKPANNLIGRLIVVVTIWRTYKFQAFFLQLPNCCSFVRLMALYYFQSNKIYFIKDCVTSLQVKEEPYECAPQRTAS